MAKKNALLYAFNRGLVSPLGLARVEMDKADILAAQMENWEPRVLGAMSVRPGTTKLGEINYVTDAEVKLVPFVYSISDTAVLAFTNYSMRIWANDALVADAPATWETLNVLNSFFSTTASWTDVSEAGASRSLPGTGILYLTGTGTNYGAVSQAITVIAGKHYRIAVYISSGECSIRVGATSGAEEYMEEVFLYRGVHYLTFTPTGTTAYIWLGSRENYTSQLLYATFVPPSTALQIAVPLPTAALPKLRYQQSGDILFIAAEGYPNLQIERRANNSWSCAFFTSDNGPFRSINTSSTTLTPSALTGNITLTASRNVFKSTHVNGLFKLTSQGQNVSAILAASDTYTPPLLVTGVGTSRSFTRTISGTWAGTLTLQRSVGAVGAWEDVATVTNGVVSYQDTFDNMYIYYRIGFKTGGYTSGVAVVAVAYAVGSTTGIVRIVSYSSPTFVSGSVVAALGSITATRDWYEGAWSGYRGFPSAVALHESRLWWAGKDRVDASVTDDYHNLNEDYVGNAGPLSRSIGVGPVDTIQWLASAQGLVVGAQAAEWVARSTSLGEPITPTNFNLRADGTRGSGGVQGIPVDHNLVFVDRTGTRLLALSPQGQAYTVVDLASLVPEIGLPGVIRTAVQRTPDTRIHFVRSDGTVAILTLDTVEDVRCWYEFTTDGTVKDVVVLPNGSAEDSVYYAVERTVGGSSAIYLEKKAPSTANIGGTGNIMSDCSFVYSGAATTTIAAGAAYANLVLSVWADGADVGPLPADGFGTVTLAVAASNVTVGRPYTAPYESVKLAHAALGGTALTQVKRIDHLGLILQNTHYQGLKYGGDFSHLDELPLIENGTTATGVHSTYDADSVEFNGTLDTDSRLCLQGASPRPCTVLAAVMTIATHEKL